MRRGVAGQTGRAARSIASRLEQRLCFERRAARPSVGEVLAGALGAVGDDQRLVAVVVALAGAELIVRVEQRKERIVRTVTARADGKSQLLVDVIGADDVALLFRLRMPRARPVTRLARHARLGQLRRPRVRSAVVADVDSSRVALEAFLVRGAPEVRSEERRVGKECRDPRSWERYEEITH